jgi:hypothetical protein
MGIDTEAMLVTIFECHGFTVELHYASLGWVEVGRKKVLVVAPLADAPTPAKRSAPRRRRSQVEILGGTYGAD